MKKLKDEVCLNGRTETITIMDLRKRPGDILTQSQLGKTFVVTRNGKPIVQIVKLLEKASIESVDEILNSNKELSIHVQKDGSIIAVPV